MFNDNVAQKPTTAVSAGKKNLKKNDLLLVNFDGSLNMGPNPFAAMMAQQNKATAAMGRKMALTKPTAGNDSSKHGRNIGSLCSKTGSCKYRKGNAIFSTRMSVEQHRYKYNGVTQKNG